MEHHLDDSFNHEGPDKHPEPQSPDHHTKHADEKNSFEHIYMETTKFIKEVIIHLLNF